MYTDTHLIKNDTDEPLTVWFEPWADELQLAPHGEFRVEAISTEPGNLELERRPHRMVVYGWAGSTLKVYSGDELVRHLNNSVPHLPEGTSTKDFVTLLFGSQPPPAEGKADLN